MRATSRRQLVVGGLGLTGLSLLTGCDLRRYGASAPARLPRLGYLVVTAELRSQNHAFLEGLSELGYVDGQTIQIDYRFSGGVVARYPELLAELVLLQPDVIVAAGEAAAQAAKDATPTIPVVYVGANDPVNLGLVANLARPGGNVTGLLVEPVGADLVGKRLEVLRDSVPGLIRIGVLSDGGSAAERTVAAAQAAAPGIGMESHVLNVAGPEPIDDVFAQARAQRLNGLLVPLTPFMLEHASQLIDLAARARLSTTYPVRQFVELGGLMAYAANQSAVHRRAALYVDKILKGERPAELPIEPPSTFELIVNQRTAQTLGSAISPDVLAQATEIIQ